MNYEKKYKEAQKWIESIYSELSHEQQMEAEAFFPELKESEDERIRKSIIKFLIDVNNGAYTKSELEIASWIAWLEKQEGCECIKKDWLEHIKQSWYKEGFIDGKYSDGTSKEWTINDAAIFKEIIDFLENGTAKLQHDLTKYANWLKIQFTPIEKQGRQFAVDKLKPKFHEGEWINNGDYTWKIVEVKPLDYILQSQDGNIVDDTIFHVNEQFHSFTIEDAKDGDVLATPNYVYIFNSIDKETETVSFYCLMKKSDEYFSFGDYRIHDEILNSTPATKEQRDVLFQKMKEAGYEWDAEKKELKKISQRMVSAEAKEVLYNKITDVVMDKDNIDDFAYQCAYDLSKDWLYENASWDDVQIACKLGAKWYEAHHKVQWSERDEKNLQGIIDEIQANKNSAPSYDINVYDRYLNWLKSLKERYAWKPSEKQMNAFEQVYDWYNNNFAPSETLTSLYNDLKKLREE